MKPSRPRISNLSFAVKLWLHTWSHLHHSSIDVRGQTITSTTNTLNLGAAFELWPRTWFNFASQFQRCARSRHHLQGQNNEFQHCLQILTAQMIQCCIIISKMCAVKPSALRRSQCKPCGKHKKSCQAPSGHENPKKPPKARISKLQHCRQTLTAHMIPFCIIIFKTFAVQRSPPRPKHWFQHCPQTLTAHMILFCIRIYKMCVAKLWPLRPKPWNFGAAFELWPRTWCNFAS